jgi:excisionase family DNA binding protein
MENPKLSFDQLPQLVYDQSRQIEELKHLFLKYFDGQQVQELDVPNMDIHGAAEFLKLKVPTIYSKVSKGELPAMKRGKRLYFSRFDLTAYLKQGRKLTISEIDVKANAHLNKTKK